MKMVLEKLVLFMINWKKEIKNNSDNNDYFYKF
jgi:hypothetical protein